MLNNYVFIMKQNYYSFWAKRYVKDGLRAMKLIMGMGIAFAIGDKLGFGYGLMIMGYVLIEALQEKE